jgi:hypothetical protein
VRLIVAGRARHHEEAAATQSALKVDVNPRRGTVKCTAFVAKRVGAVVGEPSAWP